MRFVFGAFITAFAFCSCGVQRMPAVAVPVSERVDVATVRKQVDEVAGLAVEAHAAVREARGEAEKPSPDVAVLRVGLARADEVLIKQRDALRVAQVEVEHARRASDLSEVEKERLREVGARWQEEANRYERKYLRLTKYRWVVFTAFGVLVFLVVVKIKGVLL